MDLPAQAPTETYQIQSNPPGPPILESQDTEQTLQTEKALPVEVCITREEAWKKWLSYEACLQVCIKAVVEGAPEARGFLQDHCLPLKEAFGCDNLLLQPPSMGEQNNSEGGARISWTESSQPLVPTTVQAVTFLQVGVVAFSRSDAFKGNSSHVNVSLGNAFISATLSDMTAGKVMELTPAARTSHLSVEVLGTNSVHAARKVSVDGIWRSLEQAVRKPATALVASSAARNSAKWGFGNKKDGKEAALEFSPTIVHYSVEMTAKDNKRVGMVTLSLTFRHQPSKTQQAESPYGGSITVSTWQVYETVLAAALVQEECGPRVLTLGGPWRWLLKEVAVSYGVRPTFAALSFLQWVAGPDRMTPTVDCLTMLTSELRPLMRAEHTLLPEEGNMLKRVARACEALLALTFEGYHSLSDKEATGLLSGGASGPESPAPALAPAVRLFGVIKDEGDLKDEAWLMDRLRIAAGLRYQRLHRNIVKRITENGYPTEGKRNGQTMPIGGCGSETAEEAVAYRRLEALCDSIRAEIDNDCIISSHAIFPESIDLSCITTPVYCQELVKKIKEVLKETPPQLPSSVAVDLMLAVGRLQDYVTASIPPPADSQQERLESPALFGAHIHRWFTDSKVRLCNMCTELEGHTAASLTKSGPKVLPLVPSILEAMDGEMSQYQRLIVYWPQFGALLEASMCGALRDAVAATSRLCGLVQKAPHVERPPPPMRPPLPPIAYSSDITPRKLFSRKGKSSHSPPPPPPPLPLPSLPPRAASPPELLNRPPSRRLPWQWHAPVTEETSADEAAASTVAQAGVAPHEAKLLNSLRLLLSAAPAMEAAIKSWCHEGRAHRHRLLNAACDSSPRAPTMDAVAEEGEDGADGEIGHFDTDFDPELGSHFLQVVGELRSQYAVAVKLAAQRLTDAIFSQPGAAPSAILDQLCRVSSSAADLQQPYWQRLAQAGDPKPNTQQHVAPLLKIFSETVAELGTTVDDRVLVALTRGLWELSSREIFEYLEGLQESHANIKNAWWSRKNAAVMLDHIDAFFNEALSAGPAAGWQGNVSMNQHDLARPLHSEKAHRLLATNTTMANSSFNVF